MISQLISVLGLGAIVSASVLPPVSTNLPWNISVFTDTVASVQNTYCEDQDNYAGLKFGDQTLLNSVKYEEGDMRVNIYDSDSLGIVVAYQGTNLSALNSFLHDTMIALVEPDSALGISWDARVSDGFQSQWKSSWYTGVQDSISSALKANPDKKVVVVGHSQGAGIAQIAALAIYHSFGDVIDKIICYGPPRVGNFRYAQDFDAAFKGKYTGVTNGQDWVYSMPPTELGYVHPSGMVWINPANSTSWTYYPDSEDPRGPDSRFPVYATEESLQEKPWLYFGDHQGIYMHSSLGTWPAGPCPARVGGFN